MKGNLLTIVSWLQRVVGLFASILLMRLVSQTHGESGVAFIGVASALSAWIGMLDFGAYAVSSNLVARYFVGGGFSRSFHRYSLRIAVFSAIGVGLLVWLIPLLGVGWGPILLTCASSLAISILFFLTAVGIVLNLGFRWRMAQGYGIQAMAIQMLGVVLGLMISWSYISFYGSNSDLALVMIGMALPTLSAQALNLWIAERYPMTGGLIPSRVKLVLRSQHGKAFLFAVICAVVHQSDMLLLAYLDGSSSALAAYVLVSKAYYAFIPVITASMQSHGPSFTRALMARDQHGFRSTIRSVLIANGVAGFVFCVSMLFFRDFTFSIMAPGIKTMPGYDLLVAFSIYLVLRIWTDLWSQVLLSRSDFMSNIIIASLQAAITSILMFVLIPMLGGMGAIMSLIIGFLLTSAWFLPWRVYKITGHLPLGS